MLRSAIREMLLQEIFEHERQLPPATVFYSISALDDPMKPDEVRITAVAVSRDGERVSKVLHLRARTDNAKQRFWRMKQSLHNELENRGEYEIRGADVALNWGRYFRLIQLLQRDQADAVRSEFSLAPSAALSIVEPKAAHLSIAAPEQTGALSAPAGDDVPEIPLMRKKTSSFGPG